MQKIKLFKGTRFKTTEHTLGLFREDWSPQQLNFTIPQGRASIDIQDGDAFDSAGNPLTAVQITDELLKQNGDRWVYGGKAGRTLKKDYGSQYFIDYHPQIHDLFVKHKLPIPEDGKSMQDRAIEASLAQLKMAGVIDPDTDLNKLSAFQQMQRQAVVEEKPAPKVASKKVEKKEEVKA